MDILIGISKLIASILYNLLLIYLFISFFKFRSYLSSRSFRLFILLIFTTFTFWTYSIVYFNFIKKERSFLFDETLYLAISGFEKYHRSFEAAAAKYSLFLESIYLLGYCCDIIIILLLIFLLKDAQLSKSK